MSYHYWVYDSEMTKKNDLDQMAKRVFACAHLMRNTSEEIFQNT